MFAAIVLEVLDSGFYEVLWQKHVVVNVYDDVVVLKIRQNRKHLLERLPVRVHPVENDLVGGQRETI